MERLELLVRTENRIVELEKLYLIYLKRFDSGLDLTDTMSKWYKGLIDANEVVKGFLAE